jgi:hypothetical protein
MGQIRKRGGVYWIRWYRSGRRYEESARTDSWEKARDLLRTREGAIANGAAITAKVGQLRFEDAAKDLIADYTINQKRTIVDLTRRLDDHLTRGFAVGACPRLRRPTAAPTSSNVKPKARRTLRSISSSRT